MDDITQYIKSKVRDVIALGSFQVIKRQELKNWLTSLPMLYSVGEDYNHDDCCAGLWVM